MTEEKWRTETDPLALFPAYSPGENLYPMKLSARKLRLFACACARRGAPFLARFDWQNLLRLAEHAAENGGGQLEPEVISALEQLITGSSDPHEYTAASTFRAFVWSDPYQAAENAACCASALAFPADVIPRLTPKMGRDSPANPAICQLLRDIGGNPFRPVTYSPEWRTDTAVALARQMYESHDFSAMPILADALQDAGCDNEVVLAHGRDPKQVHARGCWVVDGVLGKA
jgi:hypothetical protein